ncbi:M16 family metallopeptidase [Haliangium sp.]|uniref:M16 family metallopeptidase n=1 Tax=Haliangium sp. TaxID=2663208 RepID=UPI003D1459EA
MTHAHNTSKSILSARALTRRVWPAAAGLCAGAALVLAGCGATPKADTNEAGPAATGAVSAPVLFPVQGDPSVSYAVWFKAGSQNDPPGKEGLAWLTGQLIAEGSTQSHSYQEIVKLLFPMAASYEVRVDREMTTLRGRVHRDHAADFQALFTNAYAQPAFKPEDVERLRNQGLNYLQKMLRYASDEELGKAALYASVFDGTRYAHPVVGTVAGLQAITIDDIRQFYATHYSRGQTTFALGGGYDQSTVAAMQTTFAALPQASGVAQAAKPTPPSFTGRHVVMVDKPGADASISFGFPIDVTRGEDDFYALWVASSWLGEHRNSSSHLYQVIREARGLNYGDYAYVEAFPEGGFRQMPPTNVARRQQMFEIWIRTLPNDKALFALRAALRELRMLVDNGMSAEDFELTRSFLRKYLLHFAPTTEAKLGYAIDDRFYGIDDGHLARAVAKLEALTLEDVNRAISKHLQYDDLKIAIVTGAVDELREAMVNEAPSPITYPTEKPKEILDEDKEIIVEPLKIPADNIQVIPVDQIFEQ